MNRWVLILPLALFGVCGVALYIYFVTPGISGPFHDNLVPELIGFCIEGFFLVGILSLVQHVREHDRRRELWLSLRGSLRDFLSHLDIAFLPPEAEPASSGELESDPRVVERLLGEMKTVELSVDAMVSLKQVGVSSLPLAHDLISVAAQLSAPHMRWWIAIVDAMKKLSEANARDDLERATYAMLVNLREFDALKY